jgi:hypothetical protein
MNSLISSPSSTFETAGTDVGSLNGYICMYGSSRFECYAKTQYDAVQKAIAHFKPPKSKRHLVHAHLAEKGRVGANESATS